MVDSSTYQESVALERVFAAPIALVWKMWTDPLSFKAWYGPAGATVPVAELDVRPGGRRHVCMAVGPTPMQTRRRPPGRTSSSATGTVAPAGPYHALKLTGSVHIFHTRSIGASNTRSSTTDSW